MQCYLCTGEVGGDWVYIGKDTYRHMDCNPADYANVLPSDKERETTLWNELMGHADTIRTSRLRVVEILGEYHRDKLYRTRGFSTWDEFSKHLGMKRSWGYELLGIAKNQALLDCIREEPDILEERAKQVSIIAKVADEGNVSSLLRKAKTMTCTDLRNELSTQADTGHITKSYSWTKDEIMTLEDAIAKVKEENGEMSSAKALICIAQEYLGG
jgi:hypothetical protein